MLHLEPESDLAVRDAVDSHLAGYGLVHLEGEAIFETRNNRYRLLDGVVLEAADPSMCGSELVGWLIESPNDATLEGTWHRGARAVFVDPRLGKHIVVTSATQHFALGRQLPVGGSMDHHPGSVVSHPIAPATGAPPPRSSAPPAQAPMAAPIPLMANNPFPKAPPAPPARMTPRPPPPPVPPSSRPPVTRAAPPIHAPPRPLARAVAAPPARPLPYPAVPPPPPSALRCTIPMPAPLTPQRVPAIAPRGTATAAPPRPPHARPVPVAPPPPRSAPQTIPQSEPFPLTRGVPRPASRANM